MRRAAALVVALLALAGPAAAAAQACPRTSLADVEDEVMCPVCGVPLELATEAPQAQRERAYIQRLVAQCKSKDEIKAALAQQFGPRVLALPPRKGFDVAAYAVPAAAFLAGVALVTLAVLRWRRRAPAPAAPGEGSTAPAADDERLTADLRSYDL